MKAILCTRYGSPDVLQLQEIEKPSAGAHELLIRVKAAVVGPSDCAFRKADPAIIRLMYGFRKPKLSITGVEFAGEIEAVGARVAAFGPGDRVFGISPKIFGAHAEYLCLPESASVVRTAAGMSCEDAVGICDGAPTALTFLRDEAKLRPGQSLLINGASGAVGAYAVQIARFFGADVTGVCSAANAALVRSLGADRVIDYAREDFTRSRAAYDVIFDAVGKSSFSRCAPALAPGGVYLSTVPTPGLMLQMARTALAGGKKAIFTAAGLRQNKANLAFLNELFEAGALRPVIDRRYPLEQTADAHRYVETGRKKGNVIITLAEAGAA